VLAAFALSVVVVDLVAFNAVYNLTYNQTMSQDRLTAKPRTLEFLQSQTGVYRVYTQEKIVPWLSVMRESYYPNLSLIHGLSSGNGQFPLVPERYAKYISDMTPAMLNLLGVKFYMIPQVLPVDEASEAYDVDDPFTFNALEQITPTPVVVITSFEVESYLSQSVDWQNGKALALITVMPVELDEMMDLTLSAGSHTSEWAYDRSDVSQAVRHAKATVARSFPARSGYPPEDHPGYVYRARFTLPYPSLTQGIWIRSYVEPAFLHIERVTLIAEPGERYVLSHLEGRGDHSLVYRSEDVAIFQNNDVLPRIFLTYQARAVADDEETLSVLQSSDFDPRQEVLLAVDTVAQVAPPAQGTEQVDLLSYDSRRVVAKIQAPADGYLVLTDSWYPGWQVRVDGVESALLRADLIFRAVHVTAGEHLVEFVYAPASFRNGLLISLVALLLACAGWLWTRNRVAPTGSW
jgi:hypothetical protein